MSDPDKVSREFAWHCYSSSVRLGSCHVFGKRGDMIGTSCDIEVVMCCKHHSLEPRLCWTSKVPAANMEHAQQEPRDYMPRDYMPSILPKNCERLFKLSSVVLSVCF